MVIVPSESAKQEAIKKFGIGSVLSIFEAKGLENKEIILYKFFEDGSIKNAFQLLIKFIGISSKSSNILTFINIINVAVTRAETKLFLVSDINNIRKFEPFNEIEFNISNGDNLNSFLQNSNKNYEGYFQWAKKLELAGALTQAIENYLEAAELGHLTASAFANKCKGLIAKENHNYLEALSFFEQAYDCNDLSLLYEIYECEGILALQTENINLAAKKFEQANISLGEIIQKILSSSSPNKYSFCLSLILKQDIESLEKFLSKKENIKAMKFSMEEVFGFSGNQEKSKIYGKSRLTYIELRLVDWKNTIEQIVIPIQRNNQDQRNFIHKNIFKTNHPLYKDESDERLVIRLGHKFQIDQGKFLKISDGSIGQIPYRYTNLKSIRTPIDNKVEVLKVSQ
jgi:tetratricopeptide (TPR) repeat protein